MGGVGYVKDYKIEVRAILSKIYWTVLTRVASHHAQKFFRDSKIGSIYEGLDWMSRADPNPRCVNTSADAMQISGDMTSTTRLITLQARRTSNCKR